MKIRDLNGNIVDWKANGEVVAARDTRGRSKLHLAARDILYDLFPTTPIMEEVSIPIRRGTTQFFDFFLNSNKLAVEVHGQQHYKFNSLFHSTASDFMQQKKRDADKREWCEINNITLIELPYNETPEEWLTRIQNR
jgi:hypothetical protein